MKFLMEANRLELLLVMAAILSVLRIVRPLYRRFMKRRFEAERAEHEATWRSIRADDSDED